MEIKSENFEEKIVTDVSARYDNSNVEFVMQEGDRLEETSDAFKITFEVPGGLMSGIVLFKEGLRAISRHQRKQRYRLDLPELTASQESASPSDRSSAQDHSGPSPSPDREPQA